MIRFGGFLVFLLACDGKDMILDTSALDEDGDGFDLSEDGSVGNQRVVFDFAPGRGGDGMAVDSQGVLYIAAGISRPRGPHESADVPPGIWIVTPDGQLQSRIPIVEDVLTNVTFGGEDLRTLYIAAGKTLFVTRVEVPGWVVHRKPEGD